MTTDDLTALAFQMGWLAEQITVYEEHGVSGSASEDHRPGFKALLDAVRQGSVQDILVSDEYRLFRDAREVAVDVFIRLCQEHHLTVITPLTVYDFSNPMCVTAFRYLCEHESVTRYVQTAARG
jgi:DNA invertase Pin-like site-specific DNA recombinase